MSGRREMRKPGEVARLASRAAVWLLAAGGVCPAQQGGVFAPTDWPCHGGPFGNGATGDCDYPLVGDMHDARLVWISEERNLGVGWGLGHGPAGKGRHPERAAGYSGPVVADGKVYQQYFVPAGDAIGLPPGKIAALKDKRPSSYAIEAEDVLVCMGAGTGRTLWKASLPGGINRTWGRSGPYIHPVVARERVFVQGSGGHVHALDAGTGRKLWTAGTGAGTKAWDDFREKALAEKDISRISDSAFCVSPRYVAMPGSGADLVVVNDQAGVLAGERHLNGMAALDAATGKQRWTVAGALGYRVCPVVWRHAGRTYVIGTTGTGLHGVVRREGRMVCVDAATGKVVWQVHDGFSEEQTPAVVGDILIASLFPARAGAKARQLYDQAVAGGQVDPNEVGREEWITSVPSWRGYRLSADSPATKLWSLPLNYAGGYVPPVRLGDYVCIQVGLEGLAVVEPDTGKVVAAGPQMGPYMPLMTSNGRVLQYTRMITIGRPPLPFDAGSIAETSGFAPMVYASSCLADGRLYVRGWVTDPRLWAGDAPEHGAVACFDLRSRARASATRGLSPLKVTFEAVPLPGDPAGAAWSWDFGDGATATGRKVAHTYTADGQAARQVFRTRVTLAADGARRSFPGATVSVIQPLPAVDPGPVAPGLSVKYYEEDVHRNFPDLAGLKPTEVYTAKRVYCDVGKRAEMYALRFEGFLQAPTSGLYLFAARADDAARLWLDGRLVTDVVHLEAGRHRLAIEYVQGRHGRRLEVTWRVPGSGRDAELPPSALAHRP